MNIGFDAKRAYHNYTGLGNYSRTLISSLAGSFPEHQYYLFNPRATRKYTFEQINLHQVLPGDRLSKLFPQVWRSKLIIKDLVSKRLSLYHGLSHEIPGGIQKTGISSVVTMHDLIHKRYPGQFNFLDAKIYDKKSLYACTYADKIVAISKQTKADIIDFYKIPEEKIVVCYQSCNDMFSILLDEQVKKKIRITYFLPDQYLLYVGSIIERKNLLAVCKALFLLKDNLTLPLVVIGDGKKYKRVIKDYLRSKGLLHKVIFLAEQSSSNLASYKNAEDFPALYQSATALIYPSEFEGFGIPVLEALCSRVPVITSNVSSLPEAGGNAAYYIDPSRPEEIATAIEQISGDQQLSSVMKEKGWLHAQNFQQQKCASAVMNVYQSLL